MKIIKTSGYESCSQIRLEEFINDLIAKEGTKGLCAVDVKYSSTAVYEASRDRIIISYSALVLFGRE